ncbi:hypothetical protein MHI24_24235 [Paenibacillus sp. FSL K6-1096]|uniref:hypothetical protein n=1 Tax=Paenibacillus sp. FSL K6-1096 TaxID=2921460 RepID=UPI0030EC89EC
MDHDNRNQDLRTIFHNIKVPEADVTKAVMNLLEDKQMNKRVPFFTKYKLSTFAVLASLLLASSAFAATQLITLTNGKGDVVYEEKKFEKSVIPDNTKDKQLRSLKAHGLAYDLLQPGQAAAFYMAGDDAEGELYIRKGPGFGFTDAASLRGELKQSGALILDTLQDKYDFATGSLTYNSDPLTEQNEAALTAQLAQEARNSKEGYAMKRLNVSKEGWSMILTYKGEGQTILVQPMRLNEKLTIHLPEESSAETISVDGVEMLYSLYSSGSQGIRFIHNIPGSEYHIVYYIEATKGVAKEELLAIAKAYLQ